MGAMCPPSNPAPGVGNGMDEGDEPDAIDRPCG